MAGASGTGSSREAEAFARLLREFKDRSGLSYGALAKRLHMSTSTLHRYCNGTAVPVEYAPVERLARVCRASPQELVELHRHWILADAARGERRADQSAATGRATATGPQPEPGPGPGTGPEPGPEPEPGTEAGANGSAGEAVVADVPHAPTTAHPHPRPHPHPPHPAAGRRRTALIASATVAAVLAAVVVTVQLSSDGGNGAGGRQAAGAAAGANDGTDAARTSPGPSSGANDPSPSPSASATGAGDGSDGASEGGGQGADGSGAAPLTVGVRPYVYDSPCSQHFLVNSEPAQVGPPAGEQDAPRWAGAYGAVSSDEQRIALTVQGTGQDTVVLEALHVRVLTKGAPLAWNDYSMGVGCGGKVDSASFDIALDDGSPTVGVRNGQRDFPYKVSESDPEVFYVTAHSAAHDVRWDLTLDWSSGSRHGTLRIDDKGTAFRTSADVNRPGYDYPLGGSEWVGRES